MRDAFDIDWGSRNNVVAFNYEHASRGHRVAILGADQRVTLNASCTTTFALANSREVWPTGQFSPSAEVSFEISSSIVRWYGHARMERFLNRLYQLAKKEDPGGLVTHVNYPTTEYLDLSFLDLVCFNVYLESRDSRIWQANSRCCLPRWG